MTQCKHFIRCLLICCVLFIIVGCAVQPDKEGNGMSKYYRALDSTNPQKTESLKPGTAEEQEAIERFTAFYRVFSVETVRAHVRTVYADGAYFRDGYREVEGLDNIEAYFLKSAETVHTAGFDIQDVAVHEGNYYFRWVMDLTTKRWKNEPITTVGMSHVRFDRGGKVTFHQDYWDTSVVYEKIPVMGSVIRWIRRQF